MPSTPAILFLSVGKPAPLALPRGEIQSAIVKTPAWGALTLGETGLEGDQQADLRIHGGPDKAVCVYPFEHYASWQEQLARELPPGSFGENFTTEGLGESDVCIGDIYRAGNAVVQVSQPRQPCFRLAARHNRPDLVKRVVESGFTGFYFRTLEAGTVAAGWPLTLLDRPSPGVTISVVNEVLFNARAPSSRLESVLEAEGLADDLRAALESRATAAG
jgi:MOSC domain-containing protein YiiM